MTLETTQRESIRTRPIEQEMRDSFIDYSMSVIVRRALPDARDGLKPVHRRILYSMFEEGLQPNRSYQKSATVVGNVLGRYHPHGDGAVYDATVRMVQPFSLRYPLVDGQGNFGSIDGDSAAAYRYTEVRLTNLSAELLDGIQRDTVDMHPNFDGRLEEPEVLPCRLPHLLLNGSDGIAVGMATKIPPHNVGELLATAAHLVGDPECSNDDLMAHLPGPDFPTRGLILGTKGIKSAYRTGRGRIDMRARMHLEEGRFGKKLLVVTELPYQVNKTRVIEQIARLVRQGRTSNISDLRDESDRDGIRLVIEVKRDANLEKLVALLFRRTQLKHTFGIIMLALVDGRPRELDLRGALSVWVGHRLEVVRRASVWRLAKAQDRAHIVEGLLIALDHLDLAIRIIRDSKTPRDARNTLCSELSLTQRQGDAVLAMRLAQLTGMEREDLASELEKLRVEIARLVRLAEEELARREALLEEIDELSEEFGDGRRTEILQDGASLELPTEGQGGTRHVLISHGGYVKAQRAGTSSALAGARAFSARANDFAEHAFLCGAPDSLFVMTALGNAYVLPVADLPHGTQSSRGRSLGEMIPLALGDEIVSLAPVRKFSPKRSLIVVTRRGQVKRTSLDQYSNARTNGIIGVGLSKGDEVVNAFLDGGTSDLVVLTKFGQCIRFAANQIRATGRATRGVRGIDLAENDVVQSALMPHSDSEILVATSSGFGKRVPFTELKLQNRAGKGVIIAPQRGRAGRLVGGLAVLQDVAVALELSDGTMEVIPSSSFPIAERAAPGVPMLQIAGGAAVEAVHTSLVRPRRRRASDSFIQGSDGESDSSPAAGTDQLDFLG